jgi:hypothetical protein
MSQFDRWKWDHTSPQLSSDEQRWQAEADEAEDRSAAEHRRAACPATMVTPLTVAVFDDYLWHNCAGVAPRLLEVWLDGAKVASVSVPCDEAIQAPPRRYSAPAFDVPPGIHRIRVREPVTGVSGVREWVFPICDDQFLATTLPAWASERSLELHDLRALMITL